MKKIWTEDKYNNLSTEERNKLVADHANLNYKIAHSTAAKFDLVDKIELANDLAGAGFLGLIHASKIFQPERRNKFSTCAYHWIIRRQREELKHQTIARGFQHMSVKRRAIFFIPRTDGFACGFSTNSANKNNTPIVMDDPPDDWDGLVRCLDKRKREFLSLYFGLNWTSRMIGQKYKLSRNRVQTLISEAIEKLRRIHDSKRYDLF